VDDRVVVAPSPRKRPDNLREILLSEEATEMAEERRLEADAAVFQWGGTPSPQKNFHTVVYKYAFVAHVGKQRETEPTSKSSVISSTQDCHAGEWDNGQGS
jgi:hypothetical protein